MLDHANRKQYQLQKTRFTHVLAAIASFAIAVLLRLIVLCRGLLIAWDLRVYPRMSIDIRPQVYSEIIYGRYLDSQR